MSNGTLKVLSMQLEHMRFDQTGNMNIANTYSHIKLINQTFR